MNFKDSVILITGGSLGIGLDTARMAAERGAKVIITARNKERLAKVAEEHDLEAVAGDVSKPEDVKRVFDYIAEKHGRLDALINNAGYGYFDMLENIDIEKFQQVFATNVTGAMMMAQSSLPFFKKQNSGNIVNISSTAGTRGFPGGTAYCGTKFALKAMTECWRAELRSNNIRVILVNPSEVQTEFVANSGRDKRPYNPTKLHGEDIAHSICSALEMDDRGFITELTVFATNPQS
ncbi:MAG: SDR family oxidoreductase [Calditrichia bacterium]